MKRICFWLGLFLLLGNQCLLAGLNDGLVAYYPFNGNANDASGNGHNGTIFGSPVLVPDSLGNSNRAYCFNTGSDFISIPNDPAIATPNLTVSMWIRLPYYNFGILLSDYGWGDNNFCGYILYINDLGKIALGLRSGPIYVGTDALGTSTIPLSQWIHVAGSYDGNVLRVYVNGSQDGVVSNYTTYCCSAYRNTIIANASWNPGQGFNGSISDVRIYNRALLATEVRQLYLQRTPAIDLNNGLVAYYPFNGNANDASGHGNNGIVYGGVLTTNQFGNANKAYYFDGMPHYVDVGNPVGNNPSNLTETAWVKVLKMTPNHRDTIITKRQVESVGADWPSLCIGGGWSNSHKPMIVVDDDFYIDEVVGTSSIPEDTWAFLCGVRRGNVYEIYVNGNIENSRTDDHVMSGSPYNMQFMHHGAWEPQWGAGAYCNGVLGEVRIYNRALSAPEIQALYSSGNSFTNTAAAVAHPAQLPPLYCPAPGTGKDSLVLITHGWQPFNPWADISWTTTMAHAIVARGLPANWEVRTLD